MSSLQTTADVIYTPIPRTIKFQLDNETITLEDSNPVLTIEEVKELYTQHYPQLLNATIEQGEIENNAMVYYFKPMAGTKG